MDAWLKRLTLRYVIPYVIVLMIASVSFAFAVGATAEIRRSESIAEGVAREAAREEIETALVVRGLVDADGRVTLIIPEGDSEELLARENVEEIADELLAGEDFTLIRPATDLNDTGSVSETTTGSINTERGESGLAGATGERGESGAAGERGESGAAGQAGESGAAGERGDTGPAGPAGPQGEKGDTGSEGEQGDTGPAGEKGDTGPAGEKGDTGLQGEKGDTGPAGPQGEKGDPGQNGGDIDAILLSITPKGELQVTIIDANSKEVTSNSLDLGLSNYATIADLEENYVTNTSLAEELEGYTTEADFEKLKASLATYATKASVEELQTIVETIGVNVGTLRSDVNTLRVDTNTLRTDVNTLRGDTDTLRTDANILRSDVGVLRGDVDATDKRVTAVVSDISTINKGIEGINEKIEAINKTTGDLQDQITDITDTLGDLPEEYDDFGDAITSLGDGIAGLGSKIDGITETLGTLSGTYEDETFADAIDDLDTRITDLEDSLPELETTVDEISDELDDAVGRIGEIEENYVSTTTLAGYNYLQTANLATAIADLNLYTTTTDLNTLLADYATKTDLSARVPDYSSTQSGKVLGVDSSGTTAWVTPVYMMPDYANAKSTNLLPTYADTVSFTASQQWEIKEYVSFSAPTTGFYSAYQIIYKPAGVQDVVYVYVNDKKISEVDSRGTAVSSHTNEFVFMAAKGDTISFRIGASETIDTTFTVSENNCCFIPPRYVEPDPVVEP
jgi:archaellum component FlaC